MMLGRFATGTPAGWVLALAFLTGCGDDGEAAPGGGSTAGGGEVNNGGIAAGGQEASSDAGGSSGSHGADDDGSGGNGGAATGEDEFLNLGVCAFAGNGVWEDGAYAGTHDLLLIGDRGVGEELCVVRYEVKTISEPEVPCTVVSSGTEQNCSFGTVVELSSPTIITDVDGVCSESERALDEDKIADQVGESFALGFAPESTGHGNILVRFDTTRMTWTEWASAVFESGELEYRQSNGVCHY